MSDASLEPINCTIKVDGLSGTFPSMVSCEGKPLSPPTFSITITYDTNYDYTSKKYGRLFTISIKSITDTTKKISFGVFFCIGDSDGRNGDCSLASQFPLTINKVNTDGVTVGSPINPQQEPYSDKRAYSVKIEFNETSNFLGTAPADFKSKDTYTIIFPNPSSRDRPSYLSMMFSRLVGGNFSLTGSSVSKTLKITNQIEVPRIDIIGQTLIDGSDVGETIFTISDRFTYYSNKPIELKTRVCKQDFIPIEQIKKTIFYKSCPKMVSVFIGEEQFLYTKVEKLWITLDIADPNLTIFYENVIRYGMARYLLSRILYGNFNIN